MNRSFKTMSEDIRGKCFVYECSEGHSWIIPYESYDKTRFDENGQYLPNNCPTCLTITENESSTNS